MSVRLDRLVADRTGAGRTGARRLIRRGRVTVDGAVVRDPTAHVAPESAVAVDGEALEAAPPVLVHHKPEGVVSTLADPWGRPSLAGALPEAWRGRYHPVGRLDADTTGLLLFSADGAITQRLLHPRRAVERAYVATVEGAPGPGLAETLARGVATAEGTFTARVEQIDGPHVHLVVTEGKHRMVRRMLANAGHPVVALRRVRFGAFALGDLPPGETRPPTAEERAWLEAMMGKGGS